MKRESRKNSKSGLVALWVPHSLLAALDRGVRREDSDRSKFIRSALREKITRQGIQIEEIAR
jgi:metal-responsive CopG/Arc/MetJ family transcriptional regulator